MIALFAIAAVLPSPAQTRDIRCVAALAIVANAQARGAGWSTVDDVRADGAEFAALVGDDVMAGTGAPREAVGANMRAAVSAIRREQGPTPRAVRDCIAQMRARLAIARAEAKAVTQ